MQVQTTWKPCLSKYPLALGMVGQGRGTACFCYLLLAHARSLLLAKAEECLSLQSGSWPHKRVQRGQVRVKRLHSLAVSRPPLSPSYSASPTPAQAKAYPLLKDPNFSLLTDCTPSATSLSRAVQCHKLGCTRYHMDAPSPQAHLRSGTYWLGPQRAAGGWQ